MRNHTAPPVDFHKAGQGQPHLIGKQGTDPIGKLPGQHGNHPVDEVNAGSPMQRLFVKCTFFPDIVAHIRDMHSQDPVSIFELFNGNCIVQILGIRPINGDDLLIK